MCSKDLGDWRGPKNIFGITSFLFLKQLVEIWIGKDLLTSGKERFEN
jgi:hypothetical protein